MKTLNLNEKDVLILKSLLVQEIDYLEQKAIPEYQAKDKRGLEAELERCKALLKELSK